MISRRVRAILDSLAQPRQRVAPAQVVHVLQQHATSSLCRSHTPSGDPSLEPCRIVISHRFVFSFPAILAWLPQLADLPRSVRYRRLLVCPMPPRPLRFCRWHTTGHRPGEGVVQLSSPGDTGGSSHSRGPPGAGASIHLGHPTMGYWRRPRHRSAGVLVAATGAVRDVVS